jgi:hypothetical protein
MLPRSIHITQRKQRTYQLNKIRTHYNASIKCSLLNVRSLGNKAAILADTITRKDLKLVFLTETWLRADVADNAILHDACPPSFKFINVPRSKGKGGGIALLYHDSVQVKQIPSSASSTVFESAQFIISSSSKSVLFILIYRPPRKSISIFLDHICSLCNLLNDYDEIVLLGDFNLSHSNAASLNAFLSDVLVTFNLTQHVSKPTHVKGGILDLIITRDNSSIIKSVNVVSGISDHEAVLFDLDCSCSCSSNTIFTKSISYRNFKLIDVPSFSSALTHTVSSRILLASQQFCHADQLERIYHDTIRQLLDMYAPIKVKTLRRSTNMPWFNDAIRRHRRLLRRAERNWRSTRLMIHRELFVKCKRQYHELISAFILCAL